MSVGTRRPTTKGQAMTDLRKAAEQALEALDEAANILTWDGFASAATALREALAKPAVPEGWKLVPVEPTTDMCNALFRNLIHADDEERVIKAVIAAAPQPKDTP